MPQSKTDRSTLRKARLDDMPTLHELINRYAQRDIMLPRTLGELYESVRDFTVCEANGRILGGVALHLIWNDLAEIKSLAVAEKAQRRGLGSLLIEAALNEARALGVPRVFALTFRPSLFLRLGFQLIDKNKLPQKIWGECIRCHKFPNCSEQAVLLKLGTARRRKKIADSQ
ncbi:MAG: N-acetyltransferase [Candidatus Sumerlaeota bacterium]|nr:N-acetyltransferase [Candidatus Sumerlaeota bacterium]